MAENTGFKYRRAMIIDDSSIDRFIVENLVKRLQFSEHIASMESAEDALRHLSSSSEDELPEIIFLDINMPGMNGFEFLEAFAKLDGSIRGNCKIYMLSSSLNANDRSRANENSYVKGFISKPLSAEALGSL